ncbi:hypothetical protein BJY52DRAFT_1192890 [Lactarius psammicola]|nr:hypothetical protein BJY52DRAFT_1192890 [Lactarius psammicola]
MLSIIQWFISLAPRRPHAASSASNRCKQLSFLHTNDLIPAALPLPTPSGKPRRVMINLADLREDRTLFVKRQRALDKLSLRVDGTRGTMSLLSFEKVLLGNDVWVSLFGFAAAMASFRSGWKATALPPPPPAEPTEDALAVSEMPQDTDSSLQ